MRTLSILEIDFVAGGDDAEDGGGNFASHYASENRMEAGPSIHVGGSGGFDGLQMAGLKEDINQAKGIAGWVSIAYQTAKTVKNIYSTMTAPLTPSMTAIFNTNCNLDGYDPNKLTCGAPFSNTEN